MDEVTTRTSRRVRSSLAAVATVGLLASACGGPGDDLLADTDESVAQRPATTISDDEGAGAGTTVDPTTTAGGTTSTSPPTTTGGTATTTTAPPTAITPPTTGSTATTTTAPPTAITPPTTVTPPATVVQTTTTIRPATTTTTRLATTTTTVVRRDQTLSWPTASGWTYGESRVLGPTATSGLPVQITGASGSCEIDNAVIGTVRAVGVGTCSVTASQAGSDAWLPVDATHTFAIGKATASLTGFSNFFRFRGDVGCLQQQSGCPTYPLTASADAGVPVTFTLGASADEVCQLEVDQLWLVRYFVLPMTCPVVIEASDTATHVGFVETRTVHMYPFKTELSVALEPVPDGLRIVIDANYSGFINTSCSLPQRGVAVGRTEVRVSDADIEAGCNTMTILAGGGDASKTTECRDVDVVARTITECFGFDPDPPGD